MRGPSNIVKIGQRNILAVTREAPPGVYLDGGQLGEILLPRRYIPAKPVPGQLLDVFIYLDSEDRLVATTETPLAMAGEFACLKVVSVNRDVGAFLDWGLPKDLLLPFREQQRPLRAGDKVVVAVYVDQPTNRIVASTRLQRHLSRTTPPFAVGQPVNLLIADETPLGYNAIVEHSHLGLLYRDSAAMRLYPGQSVKGFVRALRPGGKIDLSLDEAGYRRVAPLTIQILKALQSSGGRLNLDDSSSPEAIRQSFGVSKKAFKQALGALYKHRRIRFENSGIALIEGDSWEPAE
jgi:predicted RNA-binding protein (virulence factor B family)